jgi:hypothetical protein
VTSENAGVVDPWQPGPRKSAVIGVADANDISILPLEGVTIRTGAPDWLGAEPQVGKLTKPSLGKFEFGIPDSGNPDANQYQPEEDEDYSLIYNAMLTSKMGDAYARLVLMNEMLRGRTGSLTGRFRLDIAPGSTIAIEVANGGKFVGNPDPSYLYGLVQGVQLKMSGGGGGIGSASTTYSMINVMTAQEHDGYLGLVTEYKHPIFNARYMGAQLTGEPQE